MELLRPRGAGMRWVSRRCPGARATAATTTRSVDATCRICSPAPAMATDVATKATSFQ